MNIRKVCQLLYYCFNSIRVLRASPTDGLNASVQAIIAIVAQKSRPRAFLSGLLFFTACHPAVVAGHFSHARLACYPRRQWKPARRLRLSCARFSSPRASLSRSRVRPPVVLLFFFPSPRCFFSAPTSSSLHDAHPFEDLGVVPRHHVAGTSRRGSDVCEPRPRGPQFFWAPLVPHLLGGQRLGATAVAVAALVAKCRGTWDAAWSSSSQCCPCCISPRVWHVFR